MAVCFDGEDAKVGGAGGTARAKELLGKLHIDDETTKDDAEVQVEHAKV
jgi:hypothetical protein